jgi:hypothetical protein
VDSISSRIAPYLILAGLLTITGYAQETPAPNSGSSTSASAKPASPASDRVVLKVGNMQVTEDEFESRVKDIEPQGGGDEEKELPAKDRRKLGDDYASVLMLSQQAVANHLDSSPEVSRQLAVARMQVLSDAEFASLMNQAKPSFEEVSQYYSAHAADYDEVQIRRLFIWKQRGNVKTAPVLSSAAAKARADQIRQANAAGTNVAQLSGDLRKSGDGMLDPKPLSFPRGELPPAMEKAVFLLKEGEWGEVEDTPARLLLIQLVKRDRRQLGQVSSEIEKELQGQKMDALLDDLKKKAGIWLDEQYFGTAVAPVPGAQRRDTNPPSELQKSAKKGESNNEDERQK